MTEKEKNLFIKTYDLYMRDKFLKESLQKRKDELKKDLSDSN